MTTIEITALAPGQPPIDATTAEPATIDAIAQAMGIPARKLMAGIRRDGYYVHGHWTVEAIFR